MEEVQFHQIKITPQSFNSQLKSANSQSSISKLQTRIVNQDIQMIENQVRKLAKLGQSLEPVIQKVRTSKEQCSLTIENLRRQAEQLQKKIQHYKKQLQGSKQVSVRKQIQKNKKLYIAQWEKRISIASNLNIAVLLGIDLEDRKSIANDLFKWIVVAIYGQPDTKFYWPNFKQQLFQKDEGKDFKQRLGKVNASNAKQEQIIKVKEFIARYPQIIEASQLQDVLTQAEKLRQVAEIYLECNSLVKKTTEFQVSIQKDKQSSLEKDGEAMKWKARQEALQERIEVINAYLKTIGKTEDQLQQKVKNYARRQKIVKEIAIKLKKGEQILQEDLSEFVNPQ